MKPSERLEQIVEAYRTDYTGAEMVPSWRHHWCALKDYLDEGHASKPPEPLGAIGWHGPSGAREMVLSPSAPTIEQLRSDLIDLGGAGSAAFGWRSVEIVYRLRAALDELEAWRAL